MPYQSTAEMKDIKIKPEVEDMNTFLPADLKLRVEDESGDQLKKFLETAKAREDALNIHLGDTKITARPKDLKVKFDDGDEDGIQSPLEIKLVTVDIDPTDIRSIMAMVKRKDNLFQFTAESFQQSMFDEDEEEQDQGEEEEQKVPMGAGERKSEDDSPEIYHS